MFLSAHSVMFHVTEVPAACAWYSKLLSVSPIYLLEDFPVLRVGGVEICFHKADTKVSSGRAGVVTYWRVENFDEALSRAQRFGGVLHRGPLAIEDEDFICQIGDPFGNLFGLVGPRSQKK